MNLARSAVFAYTDYIFTFENTWKTVKWAPCKHFENVSFSTMRFRCHETVSIGNRILVNVALLYTQENVL